MLSLACTTMPTRPLDPRHPLHMLCIYVVTFIVKRHKKISNNTGTTHYDSLQGSYWADQKDSHNEVIMTSLQGQ